MPKTFIGVAALALALSLGACGGDHASTLIDTAMQATAEARTANFTLAATVGGQDMTARGRGVFDGKNLKMSMTGDAAGQQFEVRLIGTTAYMKLRGAMGADPKKPWVRMDLSGMLDITESIPSFDPTNTLSYLLESGAAIRKSMKAEIDGQPATHYTVEVDTEKFTEKVGTGVAAVAGSAGMPSEMPVDLYLNKDNLPVRVDMDLGSQCKVSMTYSNWGTPVTIEQPPASQVRELPGAGLTGS